MSRPWMPFYVADYLADTGHLSTVEHGAYMLLIMHYWQNGGLPTSDAKLARVARLLEQDWREIRDTLAELFAEGWQHKRIDAELAKTEAILAARSAAGRASAAVRSNKRSTNAQQTGNILPSPSPVVSSLRSETSAPSAPKAPREKKKGTRLPETFEPDVQAALAEGLSELQAQREVAKFKNHFRAASGQKGVKADWPATWRNWCINAAGYLGVEPRSTGPPAQIGPSPDEIAAQVEAERAEETGTSGLRPGEPTGFLRGPVGEESGLWRAR